ncbi:hypothetical protein J3F84DRAFT_368391 [Trichoderma pleuroticola]
MKQSIWLMIFLDAARIRLLLMALVEFVMSRDFVHLALFNIEESLRQGRDTAPRKPKLTLPYSNQRCRQSGWILVEQPIEGTGLSPIRFSWDGYTS